MIAAGIFGVVFWPICSRFINAQDNVLLLADQPANEAEIAQTAPTH